MGPSLTIGFRPPTRPPVHRSSVDDPTTGLPAALGAGREPDSGTVRRGFRTSAGFRRSVASDPTGIRCLPSGGPVPQRTVARAWEASMAAGYHEAPPMKRWIRERNRSRRWPTNGCGRSGNGSRPPGKNPRTIWDGGGRSFWRGAFEAIPFQQRLCRFGACAGTIRLRWLRAEGFIRKLRKDNDNDSFRSAPPSWHFSSREGA